MNDTPLLNHMDDKNILPESMQERLNDILNSVNEDIIMVPEPKENIPNIAEELFIDDEVSLFLQNLRKKLTLTSQILMMMM